MLTRSCPGARALQGAAGGLRVPERCSRHGSDVLNVHEMLQSGVRECADRAVLGRQL